MRKDSFFIRAVQLASAAAAVLLSVPLIASPGHSQGLHSTLNGRELAKKLCTSCHIVGEEAATKSVPADVPSFADIANKPGQTPENIAGRIVLPHPPMPQVQLTRGEIADLAIYIQSLRKP